ncbi:hypothetical protein AMTRI_Chr09g36560 [Amborella trichopoda]
MLIILERGWKFIVSIRETYLLFILVILFIVPLFVICSPSIYSYFLYIFVFSFFMETIYFFSIECLHVLMYNIIFKIKKNYVVTTLTSLYSLLFKMNYTT